ncbi:MAG: hypothetical protein AAF604_09335 [Acidobacteriota bacterium]
MKTACVVLCCCFLLALPASGTNLLELHVKPWQHEITIPWTGDPVVEVVGPTYGRLTEFSAQGELVYSLYPNSHFWSVGRDRAVVTTEDASGNRHEHHLELSAAVIPNQHAAHDFEVGSTPPAEVDPGDQLSIGPGGALYGNGGALVVLDGSGEPAYFEIPLPDAVESPPDTPESPDPADSGCADLRIGLGGGGRDGWADCVPAIGGESACVVTILSGHDAFGSPVFRLESRFDDSSSWTRAVLLASDGKKAETPWIEVGNEDRSLRLDWWSEGLRLWVDGLAVSDLEVAASVPAVSALRLGASEAPAGPVAAYALDGLRVYSRGAAAGLGVLSRDSFEDDLSGWSNSSTGSGGALTVDPAAALAGDSGLAIDLGTGWGDWLFQASPANEDGAGFGFLIDSDHLRLPPGEVMAIAHGRRADTELPGNRFSLRLWHSQSGIRIQATGLDDDGTPHRTPYSAPLLPGSRVDVRWQRAIETGSRDGWLRLWLDGELVGEIRALDNHAFGLEALRLGALALRQGIAGTLVLDEFDLWSPVLP